MCKTQNTGLRFDLYIVFYLADRNGIFANFFLIIFIFIALPSYYIYKSLFIHSSMSPGFLLLHFKQFFLYFKEVPALALHDLRMCLYSLDP